jgi:hypothetical protein
LSISKSKALASLLWTVAVAFINFRTKIVGVELGIQDVFLLVKYLQSTAVPYVLSQQLSMATVCSILSQLITAVMQLHPENPAATAACSVNTWAVVWRPLVCSVMYYGILHIT